MADTLFPDLETDVLLFSTISFAAGFEIETAFTKSDDGSSKLVKKGVPVFRSGTFRDSWGEQHTWESIHMVQMVDNWNQLRNDKILESVPVRSGHPSLFGSGGEVIGWHSNLRTESRVNPIDGVQQTYLLADYEILDQNAIQKIRSGLWRNLSSEVGRYVTNNEAEYWPVYQGVAYVDFSAVEGLNAFKSSKTDSRFSLMFENPKETPVSKLEVKGTQAAAAGVASTGSTDTDTSVTQAGIGEPQETPAAPVAHSAPPAQSFMFKLNGVPTNDYAAVQGRLDALEAFASTTITDSRTAFVKELASSKKIAATMIESMTAHALSLDDNQWTAWKSAYEQAGSAPLFGEISTNQDSEKSGSSGEGGQDSAHSLSTPESGASRVIDGTKLTEAQYAQRVDTLTSVVAMHKRTSQNVETTPAYKELQELLALKK